MSNTKVYLVYFDGYHGYGCRQYLLGIYTSLEDAENAERKYIEKIREDFNVYAGYMPTIKEIILDHTYEISKDSVWDAHGTEIFLGGYVE